MNRKETLFVAFYLRTGNLREAAVRAGYRIRPERRALALLKKPAVRQALLDGMDERSDPTVAPTVGLRRVAFGSVTDAVRLLFMETPPTPEELEEMDLFMISEIKRPKGGGMEIKFFDRIKALERLSECADSSAEDTALPFYQALSEGARRLKGVEER